MTFHCSKNGNGKENEKEIEDILFERDTKFKNVLENIEFYQKIVFHLCFTIFKQN